MGEILIDNDSIHNSIIEQELHDLRRSKEMEKEIRYYKREILRMRIFKWIFFSIAFACLGIQILVGWIDFKNEKEIQKTKFDSDLYSIQFDSIKKHSFDSIPFRSKISCSKNFHPEKFLTPLNPEI